MDLLTWERINLVFCYLVLIIYGSNLRKLRQNQCPCPSWELGGPRKVGRAEGEASENHSLNTCAL